MLNHSKLPLDFHVLLTFYYLAPINHLLLHYISQDMMPLAKTLYRLPMAKESICGNISSIYPLILHNPHNHN